MDLPSTAAATGVDAVGLRARRPGIIEGYVFAPASGFVGADTARGRFEAAKASLQRDLVGMDEVPVSIDDAAMEIRIGVSFMELDAVLPEFFRNHIVDRRGKLSRIHNLDVYGDGTFSAIGGAFGSRSAALGREAKAYLQSARPLPRPPVDFDPRAGVPAMLGTALKSGGIVVGEVHEDPSGKQLLIENMPHLAKNGVKTLFLEHLIAPTQQRHLDAYFEGNASAPMPKALERSLAYMDTRRGLEAPHTFTGLVRAAKASGIRVVAFDTEASYGIPSRPTGGATTDRCTAMNYLAKQAIDRVEGKWVAFVGSAHANTHEGVPGLSELTGACSVITEAVSSPEQATIRTDVADYRGLAPDVVLSLCPHEQPQLAEARRHARFVGTISASKAAARLRDRPVGSFLLRESGSTPGVLTVSLARADGVLHVRVPDRDARDLSSVLEALGVRP